MLAKGLQEMTTMTATRGRKELFNLIRRAQRCHEAVKISHRDGGVRPAFGRGLRRPDRDLGSRPAPLGFGRASRRRRQISRPGGRCPWTRLSGMPEQPPFTIRITRRALLKDIEKLNSQAPPQAPRSHHQPDCGGSDSRQEADWSTPRAIGRSA